MPWAVGAQSSWGPSGTLTEDMNTLAHLAALCGLSSPARECPRVDTHGKMLVMLQGLCYYVRPPPGGAECGGAAGPQPSLL